MSTLDSLLEIIPRAEMSAMARDGDLYFLVDSPTPTDSPADLRRKLELVCSPEPHKLIASGWSALWIAGAASEPRVHQVCMRPGTRPRTSTEDLRLVSEFVLGEDDVVEAGATGARMTPLRALTHVLRHDDRTDHSVASGVALSLSVLGISRAAVRARIVDQHPLAFTSRALRRLALVDAIDVVHAIDATNSVEHTLEVTRVTRLKNKPAERQTV